MATAGGVSVHVRGLAELERKLGPELIAGPARNFLNRAGNAVQGESRKHAPKDRGRLSGSIAVELDPTPMPRYVRIGPNVGIYGIAQELGTKPYWPPKAPLEAWGARNGLTPQQVFFIRRKISRVGIKPKHYMRDGLHDTLPKIPRLVDQFGREIEAGAAR